MTRLYAPWNTPFVTQPCALGDATDDLVRPTYEDTPPEFRRVYRVEGMPWLSMKRCLACGDEYPPDGGYGEPGRDYCTQWCETHAPDDCTGPAAVPAGAQTDAPAQRGHVAPTE